MSSKKRLNKLLTPSALTRTALISAIIFILTSFLKLPTATGYVHLGDAAVCTAAVLLPFPLGAIAAALGASLADLAAGYPIWIIPSAIIKAAMTIAFSSRSEKLLIPRNFLAMGVAVVINAAGYYLAGSVIYGNFAVSLSEIPANLLQGALGALIFVIFAAFLDSKPHLKRSMRGK